MTSSDKNATTAPSLRATLVGALLMLSAPESAGAQVEIEADPFAYVLGGYSGHVAYLMDAYRVSVGIFAANVPAFLHGNDGWRLRTGGATAKFDYLLSGPDGLFLGVDTGYQRNRYELSAADASTSRDGFSAGVRTGYRFALGGSGLYLVPWMSVNYLFANDEVEVLGETFDGGRIFVFPTVHLGWRF